MRSIAFALLMLTATAATAEEWTRFRGPNGSGVSKATTIPATWNDTDYNWKIDLPGIGHSSPVVWKDRIYLMSGDPKSGLRYVLCIGAADGEIVWKKEFPGVPHHLHAMNSYASCTPAVDADHIYVAWSDPDKTLLRALDHKGEEKWTVDLGPWVSQHGFGTSPMLVDDLVVISKYLEPSKRPEDPKPGDSFVLAVDRKTGEERWKTPRATDTTSYSVPCLRELAGGGKELIACSTAEGIFALDPKTGKQKWNAPVISMRTVSSPQVVGDLVLATTGSGGGGNYVVAVTPESGEEVYRVKTQAPYVPTPVAYKDMLFLWFEGGIVTCVNAKDGEEVHWKERIGGNFQCSPIVVGDKLYCISDKGEVVVLAADKTFKEFGRMQLGDESRSTPAVSGGRMYLRTYSKLFSLGGKST